MQKIIENILSAALPGGLYESGFADLAGLVPPRYAGLDYGISIVRRLDDAILDSVKTGPNIDYYNHYNDINAELNEKVRNISIELDRSGIKTAGLNATTEDSELDAEYLKTLRPDYSHKMTATRAGLGWIGKTALFISKRYGPRVRLATVLIDAPVKPENPPISESLCGECSICADACPAGAASGKLWNTGIDRNEFFDPFKCRENCLKLTKLNTGKDVSICGICVSLCPRGSSRSGKDLFKDSRSD